MSIVLFQGAYRFSAGFLLVGMCVFAFFIFRIRKIRTGCFVTRFGSYTNVIWNKNELL